MQLFCYVDIYLFIYYFFANIYKSSWCIVFLSFNQSAIDLIGGGVGVKADYLKKDLGL